MKPSLSQKRNALEKVGGTARRASATGAISFDWQSPKVISNHFAFCCLSGHEHKYDDVRGKGFFGQTRRAVLRFRKQKLRRRSSMSNVHAILARARTLGLTLCVEGNRIAIAPARLCPPDLLAEVRDYKPAVMALLEAKSANLTPECVPWLNVDRLTSPSSARRASSALCCPCTSGSTHRGRPLCTRCTSARRQPS